MSTKEKNSSQNSSQCFSQSPESELRAEKRDQTKKAFDIQDFVKKTNDRLQALENENKELRKEIEDLKAKNVSTNNCKAFDDQPSRRNNIIISGLKEINEKTTPGEAKGAVSKFLKEKLNLPEHIPFYCDLIIPRKNTNYASQSNPIVKCKFKEVFDSNKIRSKRNEVKGTSIWINDDLTPYQIKVVKKLVEKKKEVMKTPNNTARIYANRYLIVKTDKGKEEFFESDGCVVIPVDSIPGWKPRPA
ncbi:unnamed protein product [Allacma fusca]|uniref:Uncharacterized protein n=1 Tax=Allacma fusca TaxID=39272 RepID=A0A8J2P258_9HEXA|nr:unnamed protein product [Allacma fusca]